MRKRVIAPLALALLWMLMGSAAPVNAGQRGRQFLVNGPWGVTLGPDGNVWYTSLVTVTIGRLELPSGQVTEFQLPQSSEPTDITPGPDGNLWVSVPSLINHNAIDRITPDGVITSFPLQTNARPGDITTGPDGNLWFTIGGNARIGRMTPAGDLTVFPVPSDFGSPQGITVGPDGALWFAAGPAIGRITVDGVVTRFPSGVTIAYDITAGLDDTLWFTANNFDQDSIGRITTSGDLTLFPVAVDSKPFGITLGSDGNVWFVERDANKLGRITPDGVIREFPLPPPGSEPITITSGSDGRLWLSVTESDQIVAVRP